MDLMDKPEVYELFLEAMWVDLYQGVVPQWPDEDGSGEEQADG